MKLFLKITIPLFITFSFISCSENEKLGQENVVLFRRNLVKWNQMDTTKFTFSKEEINDSVAVFNYVGHSNWPSRKILLVSKLGNAKAFLISRNDTNELKQVSVLSLPSPNSKGHFVFRFTGGEKGVIDDTETYFISKKYGILCIMQHWPRQLETLIISNSFRMDTVNFLLDACYLEPDFFKRPSE